MNDTAPQETEAPLVQGKLALRVEQYVNLRERRRALKKEFEEGVGKPGDANYKPGDNDYALVEKKLSAAIMLILNEMGVESARCPAGTAHKTTRTTASLADPDVFMKYVIANQQFELLDRKANTTAVRDYLKEHNALPPGVNLSSIVTIGVQKKSGTGAAASAQPNGDQPHE